MPIAPTPLRFDVGQAVGVAGQSVAAWLFLPRTPPPGDAVVAMLLHGGTYDKRYWHPSVPDAESYSFATHLASRGVITLVPDHLGMGESTRPANVEVLTPETVAAAHHAVITQATQALRTGELIVGLAPIEVSRVVGMGHSMGGMLTLVQQSKFHSYDRVAILGWSARELTVHRTADHFLVYEDWRVINRKLVTRLFHWEDVPQTVIDADDDAVAPTPRTIEDACFRPGVTSVCAAQIETPVFIGLGERDVSPDPYGEPGFYRRSHDVTLYVLAKSAHCHNFASGREQLWSRLSEWTLAAA
jgi:pimeloyl-ACP methyl ester carboxylesterase